MISLKVFHFDLTKINKSKHKFRQLYKNSLVWNIKIFKINRCSKNKTSNSKYLECTRTSEYSELICRFKIKVSPQHI